MQNRLCRLLFMFAVFVIASRVHAHLCDNIWRQSQKLIIKPEITGLVVKDKASFKLYVQSNMDRGIAKNVRLVGSSKAFDVDVEPKDGYRIKPGTRYEYDVSLTLKRGIRSGEYPLHFDAVIGKRKLRSFTVDSIKGQSKLSAPLPKAPVISTRTPVIDGMVQDGCWRYALLLKPKPASATGTSKADIAALVAGHSKNLFFYVSSRTSTQTASDPSKKDSVLFLIMPPGSDAMYKLRVTSVGDVSGSVTRGDEETALNAKELGIISAVRRFETKWCAELSIPFAALGAAGPLERKIWQLNIVRENAQGPGTKVFAEELGEIVFSR